MKGFGINMAVPYVIRKEGSLYVAYGSYGTVLGSATTRTKAIEIAKGHFPKKYGSRKRAKNPATRTRRGTTKRRGNPSKFVWASLYKKHKIGAILKEGNKQYKVVDVIGPAPHGAYGTKLQVIKTNPSELLKSGEWTPAHAVRIRKGKLEILR